MWIIGFIDNNHPIAADSLPSSARIAADILFVAIIKTEMELIKYQSSSMDRLYIQTNDMYFNILWPIFRSNLLVCTSLRL